MTFAGAGVRTGAGVLLGVDDGVALGIAVAVRVGVAVAVGLAVAVRLGDGVAVGTGVPDGVAEELVTVARGDGVAPLSPRAMPSQPVRVVHRHNRIPANRRYVECADRLLNNGDPPQDEMVAH